VEGWNKLGDSNLFAKAFFGSLGMGKKLGNEVSKTGIRTILIFGIKEKNNVPTLFKKLNRTILAFV